MPDDLIWNLIAKKLSGESSEGETKELELLLRENPDLHYPVQTIMDLWKSNTRVDQHAADEAFTRHIERMEELKVDYMRQPEEESLDNTPQIVRKVVLWPAVVVVLVIGVLFFAFRFSGSRLPVLP